MDQKTVTNSRQYSNQAILGRTIGTGAFLGLVFYGLWTFITFIDFTPYPIHYYIRESLTLVLDASRWFEVLIVMAVVIMLSIVCALIYYILAKKWVSIWLGILYGVLIAVVHLFIIHPLLVGNSLFLHSYASTVSILCMHILYGVSIGVSISFDYTESLIHRKKLQAEEKQM